MLSDALGACLVDPDLYDASLSTQGAGSGNGAAAQQQVAAGRRQPGGGGGAAAGAAGGAAVAAEGGRGHGASTAAVDALLRDEVLPLVPGLLAQEDPMPLYALKVGAGWVGACVVSVLLDFWVTRTGSCARVRLRVCVCVCASRLTECRCFRPHEPGHVRSWERRIWWANRQGQRRRPHLCLPEPHFPEPCFELPDTNTHVCTRPHTQPSCWAVCWR
jgi:hypothetical protein